jgi:hypothetical protein
VQIERTKNRMSRTTSFVLKQSHSRGERDERRGAQQLCLVQKVRCTPSPAILRTSLSLLAQLRTPVQPALAPLAAHPV